MIDKVVKFDCLTQTGMAPIRRFYVPGVIRATALWAIILCGLSSHSLAQSTSRAKKPLATFEVEVKAVEVKIKFFDANPGLLQFAPYLRHLSINPDDLSEVKKAVVELATKDKEFNKLIRRGSSADGLSKVFIVAESEEPFALSLAFDEPVDPAFVGAVRVLTQNSLRYAGKNIAIGLYTPPEYFDFRGAENDIYDEVEVVKRRPGLLAFRKIEVQSTLQLTNQKVEDRSYLYLVPPPVVLVHGTYDQAAVCWDWPIDDPTRQVAKREAGIFEGDSPYDTQSFADTLRFSGFAVFLVNYARSNGQNDLFFSDLAVMLRKERCQRRSDILFNSTVVWHGGRLDHADVYQPYERPGEGIKHALTYYRERLQVALTQADVIGHSLGGVLARAYIRGKRLPPPEFKARELGWELPCKDYPDPLSPPADGDLGWYQRIDNWHQGDVNRLITVGSTHFGSHVPGLVKAYAQFFAPEIITSIPLPEVRDMYQRGWHLGNWYMQGQFAAGAFTDQIPGSTALLALGQTPVRAHAIVGVATKRDMDLFAGLRDPQGNPVPTYRERLKSVYDKTPDGMIGLVLGQFMPAGVRDPDVIAALFNDQRDEVQVSPGSQRAPSTESATNSPKEKLFQRYAAAGFWNDFTDFTTSRESAMGGLAPSFVSTFPKECSSTLSSASCNSVRYGVLHGYEPRHRDIQNRIIELLKGGMRDFSSIEGFPPSRLPSYIDPESGNAYRPYD
ncbi:MAG: hypothetical protein J5J00_01195 [Deltaproteobacteria bacterium]|nr:hypothetical protein [Deltaproteobacteria bacterium]